MVNASRAEIEFLFNPETPVSPEALNLRLSGQEFSRNIAESDKPVIEQMWAEKVLVANPKATAGPLATLVGSNGSSFVCDMSNFKDYVATTRTSMDTDFDKELRAIPVADRRLQPGFYDKMRILAVGAYVETGDGTILVHRRSANATHAPNLIDSGCAGLCKIYDGGIFNPRKDLEEKMSRELGLKPDNTEVVGVTNVHSCEAPDFSGMISFGLRTKLIPEQIRPNINPTVASEYFFVPKNNLVDFVVDHYIGKRDMVGDGIATLMGALDKDQFNYTVNQINDSGRHVWFGHLDNGYLIGK